MIVKVTSYIRPGKAAKPRAKATLRYVTHRPNAEGERVTRALFGADGPYAKDQVYTLIDRSPKGSFYYRTVFSPDPALEDEFKNLNLWEMTQAAVEYLRKVLGKDIQFFAAAHEDQTDIRHVNAVIIVPGRLSKKDFKRFPTLLKTAAEQYIKEQRGELTPAADLQQPDPPPMVPETASHAIAADISKEDDISLGGRPEPPFCPSCGLTTPLWHVEPGTYYCQECGNHYAVAGLTGGLQQKGVQLSL
jgi:hypothetical protein